MPDDSVALLTLLVAPIASAGGTAMSVLLVSVLVLGYVALWLIWRLFFRGRADEDAPSAAAESSDPEPRDR